MARQCPRRQCRGAGAGRGRAATGWSIRSRPMRSSCASAPTKRRALRAQGFDFYDWGAGRDPAGHQLGPARRGGRAAGRRRSPRCERRRAARPAGRSSSRSSSSPPSGARPGSSSAASSARVPPQWSVAYRFVIAAAAMALVAAMARATACRLGRDGAGRRRCPRLHPVLHQFQRRLSRRAAHHLGRRRDGVRACC